MTAAPAIAPDVEDTTPDDTIRIDRGLRATLERMAAIAHGVEVHRQALRHVVLEAGYLWVTNSYVLVRHPLPTDAPIPGTRIAIPVDALRATLRATTTTADTTAVIDTDSTTITSTRNDLIAAYTQTFEIAHGDAETIPNMPKLWPTDKVIADAIKQDRAAPHLDARRIDTVSHFSTYYGDARPIRTLCHPGGPEKPALVTQYEGEHARCVGIVMPMRMEGVTPRD